MQKTSSLARPLRINRAVPHQQAAKERPSEKNADYPTSSAVTDRDLITEAYESNIVSETNLHLEELCLPSLTADEATSLYKHAAGVLKTRSDGPVHNGPRLRFPGTMEKSNSGPALEPKVPRRKSYVGGTSLAMTGLAAMPGKDLVPAPCVWP